MTLGSQPLQNISAFTGTVSQSNSGNKSQNTIINLENINFFLDDILKTLNITLDQYNKMSNIEKQKLIEQYQISKYSGNFNIKGTYVEKTSKDSSEIIVDAPTNNQASSDSAKTDTTSQPLDKKEAIINEIKKLGIDRTSLPSQEEWEKMSLKEKNAFLVKLLSEKFKSKEEFFAFVDKIYCMKHDISDEKWSDMSDARKDRIRKHALTKFDTMIDKNITEEDWNNMSIKQRLECQLSTIDNLPKHDEELHEEQLNDYKWLKSVEGLYDENNQFIRSSKEGESYYEMFYKSLGEGADQLSKTEKNQKYIEYLKNLYNDDMTNEEMDALSLKILEASGSEFEVLSLSRSIGYFDESIQASFTRVLKNDKDNSKLQQGFRRTFACHANELSTESNGNLSYANINHNDTVAVDIHTAVIGNMVCDTPEARETKECVKDIYQCSGIPPIQLSVAKRIIATETNDQYRAKYEAEFATEENMTEDTRQLGVAIIIEEVGENIGGSAQLDAGRVMTEANPKSTAINIGIQNAFKFVKEDVQEEYFQYGYNATENFDTEDKSNLQKGWSDQVPNANPEIQGNLFKFVMDADITLDEVQEYAASNIDKLDESVQADAYRATIESGNERAIVAASNSYYGNNSPEVTTEVETYVNYHVAEVAASEAVDQSSTTVTIEDQKREYIEKFTQATPKEQFEMLSRLGEAQQKTALTMIARFQPSLLEGLVSQGFGSKILAIPGLSSDVIYKVIQAMIRCGGTKRTEANNYILKHQSFFRKETVDEAKNSLRAERSVRKTDDKQDDNFIVKAWNELSSWFKNPNQPEIRNIDTNLSAKELFKKKKDDEYLTI